MESNTIYAGIHTILCQHSNWADSICFNILVTHKQVLIIEERFQLKIPALLPPYAGHIAMYLQLTELCALLEKAKAQILAQYALKILMEIKNTQLNFKLYH